MKILIGFLSAALLGTIFYVTRVQIPAVQVPSPLGNYQNYNTFDRGVTATSTTVGTTATQVFASITKIAYIANPTTEKLNCYLDDLGTTAASSSVTLHRGLELGSTTIRTASFGECSPGAENCYAFKGTLNCKASAAISIPTITK